jgi:ABC-type multidrug transport system fused ATPase/permease subunit
MYSSQFVRTRIIIQLMENKKNTSGFKYNVGIFIRLQKFLLPYKKEMFKVYFFLGMSSIFVLLIPTLLGKAVDTIQEDASITSILLIALGIILSAIVRGTASYGQAYHSQSVSQKVAYDIRNILYEKFQRQSFSFFDNTPTADLMSRATADVEAVRMLISFAIIRMIQVATLLLMVTGILLNKNWQLALVTLAVLPFIGFRTTNTSRRLRPIWLSVQQNIAHLSTILQENLSGIKVVKAFGRQLEETEKFNEQAQELYARNIEANREQAANTSLMTFSVYIAAGIQLIYGGYLVITDSMSPGDLTSFVFYLLTITMYVRMVGWLGNMLSRAVASGERIFEILDRDSNIKDNSDAMPLKINLGGIKFSDVSFGYKEGYPILNDVSFELKPGTTTAIVGMTGSGKSTLINLLSRFYDPTQGSIKIDGDDIKTVTLRSLRKVIGLVQQDIFLFSTTIRENIAYGDSTAPLETIQLAAKAAQLDDFITGLPDGYDSIVGERGINLSGGQRQRLAIARTILLNPSILILDDSLSSVDTHTEYLLQRELNLLMESRTTIIVAQRIASVLKADKILVIDKGKVIQEGTHSELIETSGAYKDIYEIQLTHEDKASVIRAEKSLTRPSK